MDDNTAADLVDVSLIGSPDRVQIPVKQLWKTGEPHSDEDTGNVADDSNYCRGLNQWLPHPSRGHRRLKPLILDTNLPPPFLHSPGYPSTVESTPSSSLYTPEYFDPGGMSLLPPVGVDNKLQLHHCPHPSIYVREIPLVNSVVNLPSQP